MRRALAVCGLIGTTVLPLNGREPLALAVSPTVAFAPATVRVRARIEPSADNSRLTIVADGPSLYRSSEIPLEGDQAPRTVELLFRGMPGGEYQVYAVLTDTVGHQRGIARQATRVVSQFGE